MDKIAHTDIEKLHDFIKSHSDDTESPIVWIAQIVEKLTRAEYYANYPRYISKKIKVSKKKVSKKKVSKK